MILRLINITRNYFERGKRAYDFHHTLNDPLYMPRFAKSRHSSGSTIKFASNACNYYERGRDKCPIYFQTTKILQEHATVDMNWLISI
jgi:hypothetical protein